MLQKDHPFTILNFLTTPTMDQTPFEQKDNTGTLFMDVQEKDGIKGKYLVRTGSIRVAGKDYWLNAYDKQTKTGKALLSLTVKEKQAKPTE